MGLRCSYVETRPRPALDPAAGPWLTRDGGGFRLLAPEVGFLGVLGGVVE